MPASSAIWRVAADPVRFEEALAWFRARVPMSGDDFYALDVAARRRAFGAAGIAQANLAAGLHRVLGKAIADGTTLDDFKTAFEGNLTAAWGGERPWQVENIFRTNLQLAYGAGRYKQLTTPEVLAAQPFWKLSVILDSRTSPICQPLAGTTLPTDHPFWQTHIPPLHFLCRTALMGLSKATAEAQPEQIGLAPNAPFADPPLLGFGRPPELGEWTPDATPLPKAIRALYEVKPPPPAPPPPPPKPVIPPEHTAAHWVQTYARFDEAGVPMANARASLERGLDTKGADLRKAFDGLETPPAIRQLLHDVDEHSTLREQLERAKASGGTARASSIRAVAALYGHQQGLGRDRLDARDTDGQFREIDKPHPNDRQRAAGRDLILRDFARQLRGFLSSKVQRYRSIDLEWKTNQRAFFRDIDAQNPRPTIVLDTSHHVRYDYVLAHEFAHSLEASDARRGRAAVAFLEARTRGEVPRPLRDLVPGSGYQSYEVATPDRFQDPYVGKRYSRGYPPALWATEVTSMGIQWLFAKPAWFMQQDEEHFLLTLGQLGGW